MNKTKIDHPIVILKPIRSELDVIFGVGAIAHLDKLTEPVLKLLRKSWNDDPLNLGGDVIYLLNHNLPREIPREELE